MKALATLWALAGFVFNDILERRLTCKPVKALPDEYERVGSII